MNSPNIDHAAATTLISTYRQLLVQASMFDRGDEPTKAAHRRGTAEGIVTAMDQLGYPFQAWVDSAELSETEPGFTIDAQHPVSLEEARVLISDLRLAETKADSDGAQLRELAADKEQRGILSRDDIGPCVIFPLGGLMSQRWRPDRETVSE